MGANDWFEKTRKVVDNNQGDVLKFPTPKHNVFLEARLSVPVKNKKFVGASYSFYFRGTNMIPQGGMVTL